MGQVRTFSRQAANNTRWDRTQDIMSEGVGYLDGLVAYIQLLEFHARA